MNTRYRTLLLAIFGLALAGATSLAQARDRHVDFSINLPHLVISSHHGYAGYPYYNPPHVAGHYHGRQLCHLSHAVGHHYYDSQPHYGHWQRHHDRRHDRHHDRHHYDH